MLDRSARDRKFESIPLQRRVCKLSVPSRVRASEPRRARLGAIRSSRQWPVRQIAENSGADGSIVVGKLTDKGDPNFGYDAQSGEYKDMVAAGIIDPTKVVRVALQDAASVAGLLITTEAMVADRPEPKGQPGMPPGGGMGGMGGMDY
jgi:chaperonin GroEL